MYRNYVKNVPVSAVEIFVMPVYLKLNGSAHVEACRLDILSRQRFMRPSCWRLYYV